MLLLATQAEPQMRAHRHPNLQRHVALRHAQLPFPSPPPRRPGHSRALGGSGYAAGLRCQGPGQGGPRLRPR
ncbi:MAG: hypothetical protein ACLP01_23885, partial [Solirubrobacteraceae bacterium]